MFRLLIFDLDDTLVASHTTWGTAQERVFHTLGFPYDPAIVELFKGCNVPEIGRIIHERLHPTDYTADACAHLLHSYLLEEMQQATLVPMPGAYEGIPQLAERFSLAIASGSPTEVINLVISRLQWQRYFSLAVSTEDVPQGKPAPDVFLTAAQRFNVMPGEVLVIEDSARGVQAAKRAGMTCFAVPSSADPQIVAEADAVFSSLADLTDYLLTLPSR